MMANWLFMARPVAAVVALVAVASAPVKVLAQTLKVGDTAPALTVSKWVKGDKISSFEKGKTYVVEFWATWCGPCKVSIPHLTDMQKANPDVKFIGVSVFESKQDGVVPFVTQMGDKMGYTVVMDQIPEGAKSSEGAMATNWMKASGQNGIPTAFVVDGSGKVAWIGHPMGGLDEVVTKVKAGTFNARAEAEKREKEEAAAQSLQMQMQSITRTARTDPKAALASLDKVIAANPQLAAPLSVTKFNLLLSSDEKAAYAYAKKQAEGLWKSQPMTLNNVSFAIADNGGKLKTPDYDLALDLAKKAVEGTKGADATVIDTLAFAYYKKGDKKNAVATQKKALEVLSKSKDVDPEMKKELEAHLALFQK
jgi:thiol-disulfide isomerase/thioredoxin